MYPIRQLSVAGAEKVKGNAGRNFGSRERREAVLLLGRRKTGISLKEFGLAVGGLDYSSVRHCGQPDLKAPHPFAF